MFRGCTIGRLIGVLNVGSVSPPFPPTSDSWYYTYIHLKKFLSILKARLVNQRSIRDYDKSSNLRIELKASK